MLSHVEIFLLNVQKYTVNYNDHTCGFKIFNVMVIIKEIFSICIRETSNRIQNMVLLSFFNSKRCKPQYRKQRV